MKGRPITIKRENALAILRAASFVPVAKRRTFLRGIVQSLRGLSRPDADVIAQAVWTQWRLAGVVPRKAPKPGFASPFKRAA